MSKARILAVDDQRYFRELIEGLLQDEGYEVETASSAVDALHLLDREVFDIVITDLVMPGVDGTELVSRIKERLPEQDIVMVTGVVDVKTAVEAMKQGATDYILKPFDRNTLADSLSKILQSRRLRDEHAQLVTENLEYVGVVSSYERASSLFSTLAVEPLAERLIEGFCLETGAQGGVVWIADDLESLRLTLKGVRGIIRVEEEAEELTGNDLRGGLDDLLEPGLPVILPRPSDQESSAMFVPLRFGGKLIALARLTDPLEGGEFGDRERVAAEKLSSHGVTALVNALRFRALERRSFRDPLTLAYTQDFYQDAVRNEIQKAGRFGHSFSMIHLDLGPLAALRRRASDGDFSRWIIDLVEHLRSALRSADLLASRDESHYDVLLPETDAVGAAVLKQRIRSLIEQSEILSSVAPDLCEALSLAAVTFPTDGTQLESLTRLVDARLKRDQVSPLRSLAIGGRKFVGAIDRLLEEGGNERCELSVEATQLLMREVERRPRDRGLLFLSPSEATLPVVREGLERLRAQKTRTEVVIVGENLDLGEEMGAVTCVPTARAGTDRPFALYYGEGPVYAMVSAHRPEGDEVRFFHTEDRSLVEHLAFQFQKDLGLPIGAAT